MPVLVCACRTAQTIASVAALGMTLVSPLLPLALSLALLSNIWPVSAGLVNCAHAAMVCVPPKLNFVGQKLPDRTLLELMSFANHM